MVYGAKVRWLGPGAPSSEVLAHLRCRGLRFSGDGQTVGSGSGLLAMLGEDVGVELQPSMEGLRLAVLHPDPGCADGWAQALRSRGAEVVVLCLDPGSLDAVSAMDPDAVLVEEHDFRGCCWEVIRALWGHPRLRGSPILMVPSNDVSSRGRSEVELRCTADRVRSLNTACPRNAGAGAFRAAQAVPMPQAFGTGAAEPYAADPDSRVREMEPIRPMRHAALGRLRELMRAGLVSLASRRSATVALSGVCALALASGWAGMVPEPTEGLAVASVLPAPLSVTFTRVGTVEESRAEEAAAEGVVRQAGIEVSTWQSEEAEQGRAEVENDLEESKPPTRAELQQAVRAEVERGHQALHAGSRLVARRHYVAALQLQPGYPRALVGLIRLQVKDGNAAGAVRHARTLVRRYPGRASFRFLLEDTLKAAGHHKAARAAWQGAARRGSGVARKRLSGGHHGK